MALQNGARLGPYEIQSALGAGGMGEVYKARDTRLDRVVAIKILSAELAADPEFRERFEREARVVSALDHPHVCAVYDVGNHDGVLFLVMQYLDGETLAARIARRPPLTLDEALRYAIEIAQALAKAHRQHIVHRDLKPGNVMLTKSGTHLLDFGLAKITGPSVLATDFSHAETAGPGAGSREPLTAQGTILGTFQYMSPEQIEGRDVDTRSDIFALGAIIHEMITGRKAFEARSQASLLGAIMHGEPPALSSLQPLAPSSLDRIVKHCLAKDPDDRFQSAADLASELAWVAEDRMRSTVNASSGAAAAAADRRPPSRPAGAMRLFAQVGLVALGALMAGTLAWFLKPASVRPASIVRSQLNVSPADQLQSSQADSFQAEGRPTRTSIVLAPDGKFVIFNATADGQQRLFLRALDQLDAKPLPGTEDATSPFLSPDGRWIGFWSRGSLRKVEVAGGAPSVIAETPDPYGISWGTNDVIVFGRFRDGLERVSASGGKPEPLTQLDASKGDVSHRLPTVLPGGKAVVFTVTRANLPVWDKTEIAVQSLESGERKVLIDGGADARYVNGHLVYLRSGTLMAVPFDVDRLAVTGGAVGLVSNVMQAANLLYFARDSGAGQFSVSASGSLAYVAGGVAPDPERTLAWVTRSGEVEPLAAPVRPYVGPRVSPDGQFVAAWLQGGDRNIWIYDLARQTMSRFTSDGRNSWPIWTPDGARIAFTSAVVGPINLFSKSTLAGGSNAVERMDTSANSRYPSSWSPDGKTLVFCEENPTTGNDIGALDVRTGQVHPVVQTRFGEQQPELSPDGRWLAYTSDSGGRQDVYVQPYPGPGAPRQISISGGGAPAWSKDGKELFFMRTARPASASGMAVTAIFSAPLTITATGLTSGPPKQIVEGKYSGTGPIRWYDVAPDGRRFLVVLEKERPPARPNRIVLVQNWSNELEQRVPAR